MTFPFEPACMPLITGELPHQSSGQALELLRQYASDLLPFPVLPRRSMYDQPLVQGMLGFPGFVADTTRSIAYVNHDDALQQLNRLALAYLENNIGSAALTEEYAAGLYELLRQYHTLRSVRMVVGQMVGPISTAMQLTDEHQQPLAYHPALFDAVAQHLSLRMAWLERQLHSLDRLTLVCVQEPFLDVVDNPFAPFDWDSIVSQIRVTLAGLGGTSGLIARGAAEWPNLLDLDLDLLVVDAYQQSALLEEAAPALRTFFEHGSVIGLGIIPADEGALQYVTADSLTGRVVDLLERLSHYQLPIATLTRQAFLAADGDLSALNAATTERALRLIGEVSALVRREYQLA